MKIQSCTYFFFLSIIFPRKNMLLCSLHEAYIMYRWTFVDLLGSNPCCPMVTMSSRSWKWKANPFSCPLVEDMRLGGSWQTESVSFIFASIYQIRLSFEDMINHEANWTVSEICIIHHRKRVMIRVKRFHFVRRRFIVENQVVKVDLKGIQFDIPLTKLIENSATTQIYFNRSFFFFFQFPN